jgi:hypothetical protein
MNTDDRPSLDEVILKSWGYPSQMSKAIAAAYPDATDKEIRAAMVRVTDRLLDEKAQVLRVLA